MPLQNSAKGCSPRRADASLGAGSGTAPRTAAMRPTNESYYKPYPGSRRSFWSRSSFSKFGCEPGVGLRRSAGRNMPHSAFPRAHPAPRVARVAQAW